MAASLPFQPSPLVPRVYERESEIVYIEIGECTLEGIQVSLDYWKV